MMSTIYDWIINQAELVKGYPHGREFRLNHMLQCLTFWLLSYSDNSSVDLGIL